MAATLRGHDFTEIKRGHQIEEPLASCLQDTVVKVAITVWEGRAEKLVRNGRPEWVAWKEYYD